METDVPGSGVDERIAANLRAARERAGLTQGQLAEKMRAEGWDGFRQQTVTKYEGGHRKLTTGEADALATALGTDLITVMRPAGLAQRSWLILDAMRKMLDARDELAALERQQAATRKWLEQMVGRARDEGLADQLKREIAAAERALGQEKR